MTASIPLLCLIAGLILGPIVLEKVKLGRTGIKVSRLGIGTGSAHPSGHCAQALMDKNELAELLIYALECGINFWDTASAYKTYPHIRHALKEVRRDEVVLCTKVTTSGRDETIRDFEGALTDLNVDYIDICLLHGVRTRNELRRRAAAFDSLLELKQKGKVRAVGISSHGLSALASVTGIPEIDVVWARINYAGFSMDTEDLMIYDQLASIHWLKNCAKDLLPKALIQLIRPQPDSTAVSTDEREKVMQILQIIHSQSKGVVGMKIMAEGVLGNNARRAIEYANRLSFLDSFIIGMLNKKEIEENCAIVNSAKLVRSRKK